MSRLYFLAVAFVLVLALHGLLATEGGAQGPAVDGREAELAEIEVSVTDSQGMPVTDLEVSDFGLWSGEQARDVVDLNRQVPLRHFVVLVDLPSAPVADRHSAMPALRQFLRQRAAADDRVTIAVLRPGAGRPVVDLRCKWTTDLALLQVALDSVVDERDTQLQARRQRQSDAKSEAREAYLALEQAMSWVNGDRRRSLVFYLGRALNRTPVGTNLDQFRDVRRPRQNTDVEPGSAVGSVRYLVSLPREGPLRSNDRRLGDRLLSTVLKAEATIYPLFPGERNQVLGSQMWLAAESGGRVLPIRGLEQELKRLDRQLDQVYTLSFRPSENRPRAGERWFSALKVETPGDRKNLQVRHLQALSPRHPDDRLDDLSRAAWFLESEDNPLAAQIHLEAPDSHGRRALKLTLPTVQRAGSFTLSLAVPADKILVTRRQELSLAAADPGAKELQLQVPLRLPDTANTIGLALRRDSDGVTTSMVVSVGK